MDDEFEVMLVDGKVEIVKGNAVGIDDYGYLRITRETQGKGFFGSLLEEVAAIYKSNAWRRVRKV